MADHCTDIDGDRTLGKMWERAFMALARRYKRCAAIPNQQNENGAAIAYGPDGRAMTVADVQLLCEPNEHHEIKHKNPTRSGCYGLEEFRLKSLYELSAYPVGEVLYTIHDWELAGSRDARVNKLSHWRTARIVDLMVAEYDIKVGPTWSNGRVKDASIYYWASDIWKPLAQWWNVAPVAKPSSGLWTPELLEWRDEYAVAEKKHWGDAAHDGNAA